MVDREIESEISILKNEFPIIAILGPRQSGKTTLSKKVFPGYQYISLEDLDHRDFAQNDPRGFLKRYDKKVIFDEIQRVPTLMSFLQTHVDSLHENGTIIITGSHNFLLMEQISQSLAGRVGITTLLPFTVRELDSIEENLNTLMFKGFYPRIYDQHIRPDVFYKNYISTYVEKDIRHIRNITNYDTFIKFLRIAAGRTGQELNTHTISDECGISHNTVKDWLSILEASFIIHRLRPFHKNYNKRIVKNPKIYFTDTGLVCNLLGIRKEEELDYHFLKGNIFETFIMTELLKYNYNTGEKVDYYFWRDSHKKELDVIIDLGTRHFGIEIKSSSTIQEKYFSGLEYWLHLTENDRSNMYLIYGGDRNMVRNGIHVVSWKNIFEQIVENVI